MKNLVLGTAALLALMACSKKTPDADTTTTTSGAQDTTVPATTPAPINNDTNPTTPVTAQPKTTNNFKDGGHVDTMGTGAYDQGGPNGIGQPLDRDHGAGNPTTNSNTMQDQRMAPVDNAKQQPVKKDYGKVGGNGTTPGTTGGLNTNH